MSGQGFELPGGLNGCTTINQSAPIQRRICHRGPFMFLHSSRTAAWLGCMLLVTGSGFATVSAKDKEPDCNRRCLLEFLQTYTEGLLDNDTSRTKVASNLRVTSNGADVSLGKGG